MEARDCRRIAASSGRWPTEEGKNEKRQGSPLALFVRAEESGPYRKRKGFRPDSASPLCERTNRIAFWRRPIEPVPTRNHVPETSSRRLPPPPRPPLNRPEKRRLRAGTFPAVPGRHSIRRQARSHGGSSGCGPETGRRSRLVKRFINSWTSALVKEESSH